MGGNTVNWNSLDWKLWGRGGGGGLRVRRAWGLRCVAQVPVHRELRSLEVSMGL